MTLIWKKQDQYTGYGFFRTGEEIDTTEKGIPAVVVESWISTGWAEEIGVPVINEPALVPKVKAKKYTEVKNG
jgi:hypothetical protein